MMAKMVYLNISSNQSAFDPSFREVDKRIAPSVVLFFLTHFQRKKIMLIWIYVRKIMLKWMKFEFGFQSLEFDFKQVYYFRLGLYWMFF